MKDRSKTGDLKNSLRLGERRVVNEFLQGWRISLGLAKNITVQRSRGLPSRGPAGLGLLFNYGESMSISHNACEEAQERQKLERGASQVAPGVHARVQK